MLRDELAPEFAYAARHSDAFVSPFAVIVYGAGNGGRQFLQQYRWHAGVRVVMVCDDDPQKRGTPVEGYVVRSPEDARSFPESLIVIALADRAAVVRRLEALGLHRFCFSHDFGTHLAGVELGSHPFARHFDAEIIREALPELERVDQLLEDEASKRTLRGLLRYRLTRKLHYLEPANYPEYQHPVVQARPGDTVIDAGGFDGDTAILFASTMADAGSIYVFEPSPANVDRLAATISSRELGGMVHPVAMAIGAADGTLHFDEDAGSPVSSKVSAEGRLRVGVVALDSFCASRNLRPTLMKFDIEGHELPAIQGAADLIGTMRPRLQMCVYHLPTDLWKIPLALHALCPEYRFFLGQHTVNDCTDTVLYAV